VTAPLWEKVGDTRRSDGTNVVLAGKGQGDDTAPVARASHGLCMGRA
jgi:hypothetical protein